MRWFKGWKKAASFIPLVRFVLNTWDTPKVWSWAELWASAPTGLYKRTENDSGVDDEAYAFIMPSLQQRDILWLVPNRGEMFIMHKDSDCGEYTLVSSDVHLSLEVMS